MHNQVIRMKNGLVQLGTSQARQPGHGLAQPDARQNFFAGYGLVQPEVGNKSSSLEVTAKSALLGDSLPSGQLWIRSMALHNVKAKNLSRERAYRRIVEAPLIL